MIFSEIYSVYYNAVASLIEKAINEELSDDNIVALITEKAFSESFIYICEAIRSEEWCIITKEYKTPIKHTPKMPLTSLQLSFLKAICLDKRFALFMDMPKQLETIEPLYIKEDFYVFDQFEGGDPYENEQYRMNFKTIMKALKEKRQLYIIFLGGKGRYHQGLYQPRRLEFSAKDDCFRLLCSGSEHITSINLARIESCELVDMFIPNVDRRVSRKKEQVQIAVKDQRKALERVLTSFANYKKETRKISDDTYHVTLTYNKEDETELLIRILSFGPMVQVLAPQAFIGKIKERIHKQIKLQTYQK